MILAVDHNPNNLRLLGQFLDREGFENRSASSLMEVDRILADPPDIDLALLDPGGFGRDLWERCETLRQEEIPFIILSTKQHRTAIRQESYAQGASGVLAKPVVVRELLNLIHSFIPQ